MPVPAKQINLMRGWPSPDVLPAGLLSAACQRLLADPADYTPILQYGPSQGHGPLRDGLARWLGRHYGVDPDPDRICITGGASQSLACILQSFTDPAYTRAGWLIAPCYYLACGIFDDAGLAGRLRASPEDDEGVDLDALAAQMARVDEQAAARPAPKVSVLAPTPARLSLRPCISPLPFDLFSLSPALLVVSARNHPAQADPSA